MARNEHSRSASKNLDQEHIITDETDSREREFKQVECPLKLRKTCRWTGTLAEIKDHCKSAHGGDVRHLNNLATITLRNFFKITIQQKPDRKLNYPFLIEINDELFQIEWDYLQQCGIIRLFLIYIGIREDANLFHFAVKFVSGTENLQFATSCQPYDILDFGDVKFIKIIERKLPKICNKIDGNVCFILYVYKNGELLSKDLFSQTK